MNSLECLIVRCLSGFYTLMGLVPLPPSTQLYRLLFAIFIRCVWSVYLLFMLITGFGFLGREKDLSISYISGTALFIGYSLLSILVQLESALKHRSYARLQNLQFQARLQVQRLGMARVCRKSLYLLLLIGAQLACDIAKFWTNSRANISPVLNRAISQMWLLRFRYFQLLEQVIEMNQRAEQLRQSLLGLADGTDIWQPFGLKEDTKLNTMRLTYDRIFECYETFSDCYGWGILGLQMICGIEFVSNAYWIITEAYKDQQFYMFVFNGATCVAMGTLITSLFWYGDASTQNTSTSTSDLIDFQSVVMQLLSISRRLFHLVLCLFGVRWNRSIQRLQLLVVCLWLVWYTLTWTHAATRAPIFEECTLDCLMTHTMFVLLTMEHVIILLDTFVQRGHHRLLLELEMNHFDYHRSVFLSVCAVIIPSILIYLMIIVATLWVYNEIPLTLFWLSASSRLGLHFRLFAFLSDVLLAKQCVLSVRDSLKLLARKQTMRLRQAPEIEPVIQLKLRYGQLNRLFAAINLSYGNSILTTFIVLFISFVFNSYWLVKMLLLKPNSMGMALTYLGIILNSALIFSTICWHCQQCFNISRQIGCLISKLIKPLGSKRYNDLVCEFLLQTLHQRFVLTAKDFFSLNLPLLSSMSAAVVTYLVILIQFMFAEKGSRAALKTELELELQQT